ncbi:hypothetical protein PVAP13_7KG082400 [Panicum virgatum]|uniref:Uncharacterized protein n=2 Tax=Panicum virgatum TaxID=38727 RepID=A0A8T0Q8W1_PANVG|nr:hypothetical protein PVAP13_7KG082400 [Panicum virgatum]
MLLYPPLSPRRAGCLGGPVVCLPECRPLKMPRQMLAIVNAKARSDLGVGLSIFVSMLFQGIGLGLSRSVGTKIAGRGPRMRRSLAESRCFWGKRVGSLLKLAEALSSHRLIHHLDLFHWLNSRCIAWSHQKSQRMTGRFSEVLYLLWLLEIPN